MTALLDFRRRTNWLSVLYRHVATSFTFLQNRGSLELVGLLKYMGVEKERRNSGVWTSTPQEEKNPILKLSLAVDVSSLNRGFVQPCSLEDVID